VFEIEGGKAKSLEKNSSLSERKRSPRAGHLYGLEEGNSEPIGSLGESPVLVEKRRAKSVSPLQEATPRSSHRGKGNAETKILRLGPILLGGKNKRKK